MSPCSFQEQLFSVVEVLAKAATEEINRRVEENCALIRVELSRSQRDIDHLKKKCLLMENELRKVRGRARRKVFMCGSTELTPSQSISTRGTQPDPEPSTQHIHQSAPDVDGRPKATHSLIKVEGTSNELWRTDEGTFSFEHHDDEPRDQIQEPGATNSTSVGSPVKTSEENLNHIRLHLKTEDDERTDAREETDPRSEGAAQFSCHLSGFENGAEDVRPGLYGVSEQSQPAWCRVVQRPDGPVAHPHHGTPAPPRPSGVRSGVSFPSGAFSSRGRGGLRRFRSPWVTGVNGERRFGCSYCERTFVRFGQLKEHLRSHTGERPYTCAQCGRSFTKQGNLIRHAVVHSGEKPYQCNLCGKCFTQRSSMKSHQKTHLPHRDASQAARTPAGHFL